MDLVLSPGCIFTDSVSYFWADCRPVWSTCTNMTVMISKYTLDSRHFASPLSYPVSISCFVFSWCSVTLLWLPWREVRRSGGHTLIHVWDIRKQKKQSRKKSKLSEKKTISFHSNAYIHNRGSNNTSGTLGIKKTVKPFTKARTILLCRWTSIQPIKQSIQNIWAWRQNFSNWSQSQTRTHLTYNTIQ